MPYEEFEYQNLVKNLRGMGSEIVSTDGQVEAFPDIDFKTMQLTGLVAVL